jgi:hypothetical protein
MGAVQILFFIIESEDEGDDTEYGPFLTKFAAIEAGLDMGFARLGDDMLAMRGSCECGCEGRLADIVERRVV